MSANCDVIVIFPIYDQFRAIQKTDSGCIVCERFSFSLKLNFYLTTTERSTKNF